MLLDMFFEKKQTHFSDVSNSIRNMESLKYKEMLIVILNSQERTNEQANGCYGIFKSTLQLSTVHQVGQYMT